jgi:hypothetical protein
LLECVLAQAVFASFYLDQSPETILEGITLRSMKRVRVAKERSSGAPAGNPMFLIFLCISGLIL